MKKVILAVIGLMVAYGVAHQTLAKSTESKSYQINWLLAHEPVGLFIEAANSFAKNVEQRTNGNIKVNVISVNEYTNGTSTVMDPKTVVRDLQLNKVQMTQTYTTALGNANNNMWALDLPYLFKSHEHATKVLDGPIGESILAGLQRHNLRGLSFTYSGGFRVLPTLDKPIKKYEDIKGLRIQTSGSPVARAIFEDLGALAIAGNLERGRELTQKKLIEGLETTYPRVYALDQQKYTKVINDTKHSLFLTSIVINDGFYQTLPAEYQNIVKEEARKAAVLERKISIEDGIKTKQRLKAEGLQVVELSEKEQARLRKRLQPIYDKFDPMFDKGLVEKIAKAAK
ncbi:MAG: TRAP transporter substrate-binding protein [Bdellovibrionales bacterium]|nr:TRAP transporter substrate-binding protein [Bdellovibrionales bacterium]